jgi:hypothetical protein
MSIPEVGVFPILVAFKDCQLLVWRKGRLAPTKGEEEREGCSMRVVCLRNSNPSPPAFAPLRRGTQSSPLAKERGGKRRELTANEHYPESF